MQKSRNCFEEIIFLAITLFLIYLTVQITWEENKWIRNIVMKKKLCIFLILMMIFVIMFTICLKMLCSIWKLYRTFDWRSSCWFKILPNIREAIEEIWFLLNIPGKNPSQQLSHRWLSAHKCYHNEDDQHILSFLFFLVGLRTSWYL